MNGRLDVAILGGGCAGLSLAVQIASRAGAQRSVAILEQRTDYERDRTWCGWSVEPHPFQRCVDRRWSRWAARWRGESRVHTSSRLAYEHIRADRFYAEARQVVEATPSFALELGVEVHGVEPGANGGATLIRSSSGHLEASLVVDTRPPRFPRGAEPLLQHFLGLEVETAGEAFDPATVTLMDFDVDQSGGVHFMYVLPFSRTRALVESTVLSQETFEPAVYEARIRDYVGQRYGQSVERVHYQERGAIPMAEVSGAEARAGSAPRAGAAGGAIKPSSGYAFHAIQRTTAAMAGCIVAGEPVHAPARSRLDGWLDRVFLSYLRRYPERGPETFFRLFRSIDADGFARFMMERPEPSDRLRVIGAMPTLPFAREALRVAVA